MLFFSVYSFFWPIFSVAAEMTGQINMVLSCPHFWMGFLLVPTTCLIQNFFWKLIKNTYKRGLLEEIQELESRKDRILEHSEIFEKRTTAASLTVSFSTQPCEIFFWDDSVDLSAPHGYAFSQTEGAVVTQEELVRAFSQTEGAVVTQEELVRAYDTAKMENSRISKRSSDFSEIF
ncbi:phospholipid-transporting ATPase IB-like [Marmota marmota marmota]|uniref:phospholipid-transporting ATPase IB-like n=1 Tax=Marmota marmota marmota TaxID=9994 RepID=UPI002093B99E|nr:phospholipid-transporting ATPase IB-like [Marmota marmota marmota]